MSNEVKVDVSATFNITGVKTKLAAGIHRAQEKLDAQVIADSNYYCPLKTGTLQKSAVTFSVLGSGTIRWRTPYARKQYYGTGFTHDKDPNPNACAKWFEAAKARKMKQWEKLVDDEIKHN